MKFELGAGLRCDLQVLIDTRALIQANSGGGKSHALRRLLEQTHGKVQQLVIDPEGEFASLRERFDYVLAARQGGDTAADPRAAKLLAERLLQLNVSAILDIYELKAHERIRFVRAFLEALVDAPKTLWHPALIVVDEAHVFCPQQGEAESAGAVIDLCTRGRKRGFSAILATQRLSKLHKDAAAELNNKLIGRTGLDVDRKRAGEELGFTTKEQLLSLRQLEPGHFYAFGPALSLEVRQVLVGPVQTTHPKAGSRIAFTAPPPTDKVRALLPQLADLPAEAEQKQKSLDELKRDNATLRATITRLERSAPTRVETKVETKVERVEVPVLKNGQVGALERISIRLEKVAPQMGELVQGMRTIADGIRAAVQESRRTASAAVATSRVQTAAKPLAPATQTGTAPAEGFTPVMQRIVDGLVELEVLGANIPPRELVAFMAGYTNIESRSFKTAVVELRARGLIEFPAEGAIRLTAGGRDEANPVAAPATPREIQDRVCQMLGGASRKILEPLIAQYPEAIDRVAVAAAAGYTNIESRGFKDAIGRLRTLGFVDYPGAGTVRAAPVLFLEASR